MKKFFFLLFLIIFKFSIYGENNFHIVEKGDTLYSISLKYGISVEKIKEINGLNTNTVYVGNLIMLKNKEENKDEYIVLAGDTLWGIALRHGIDLDKLKLDNNINNNTIHVGQKLKIENNTVNKIEIAEKMEITEQNKATETLEIIEKKENVKINEHSYYTVLKNDNLSSIARVHQMTLKELKELNSLKNNTIHIGQKLKVKTINFYIENSDISYLFSGKLEINKKPIIYNSDYYYYRAPKASKQLHRNYYEDPFYDYKTLYNQANYLISELNKKIDKENKLSNYLNHMKIVIDPGHGGLDPGSISEGSDNNGTFFILEDEYCYDLALRVYILLKLHGADVIMTILSPNHLLRESNETFVNEKNEVLNLKYLKNHSVILPRGNRESLLKRIEIAKNFYNNQTKDTLFLSIHSDNFKYLPEATSILYYKDNNREDTVSKKEVEKLLPYLGAGAHKMGKSIRVLNNNPANIKYLVEVKNLAYTPHIWDMKQATLRQKEAEKIVYGLIKIYGKE